MPLIHRAIDDLRGMPRAVSRRANISSAGSMIMHLAEGFLFSTSSASQEPLGRPCEAEGDAGQQTFPVMVSREEPNFEDSIEWCKTRRKSTSRVSR